MNFKMRGRGRDDLAIGVHRHGSVRLGQAVDATARIESASTKISDIIRVIDARMTLASGPKPHPEESTLSLVVSHHPISRVQEPAALNAGAKACSISPRLEAQNVARDIVERSQI
jgi:hypothetical protein